MNPIKTYFNWSTGKDSALALHYLQQDKAFDVGHLLTSVNQHHDRVSMHGLRRDLMQRQIEALNIPFSTIELPEQPDMEVYEHLMKAGVLSLKAQGFTTAAFGDIFLEDLRVYREKQLAAYEIETVFPLWKKDTRQLLTEFIKLGFKAILVCVNARKLDASFSGRIIDDTFLNDLPPDVDPCGENGEFHTFCFDGPIFKAAVPFQFGERIYKEYDAPTVDGKQDKIGFWFQDLTTR